jgi:hypothetical protein
MQYPLIALQYAVLSGGLLFSSIERIIMPSLLNALEHHGRDKKPLVGYLGILFMTQLSHLGWVSDSKLGGAGSYFWTSPDGKKGYHFRVGGLPGTIDVRDRYQKGKLVMRLATESDCRIFVKKILGVKWLR